MYPHAVLVAAVWVRFTVGPLPQDERFWFEMQRPDLIKIAQQPLMDLALAHRPLDVVSDTLQLGRFEREVFSRLILVGAAEANVASQGGCVFAESIRRPVAPEPRRDGADECLRLTRSQPAGLDSLDHLLVALCDRGAERVALLLVNFESVFERLCDGVQAHIFAVLEPFHDQVPARCKDGGGDAHLLLRP